MAFPNPKCSASAPWRLAVAMIAAAVAVPALYTQSQPAPSSKIAPAAQAKTLPQAARPAAPVSAGDAALEAIIRAKFAKSKIDADHFQVRVQGGVATIEGRTDVLQHKGVATRLAKSAGAKAVNNNIQPSDAARQKAARNLETGRRRVQVKRGEPRSDATEKKTGR